MRRLKVATLGQGARHYSGASQPVKTAKNQCLTTPGLPSTGSVAVPQVEVDTPTGFLLAQVQVQQKRSVAVRADDLCLAAEDNRAD
jgi:hypothetical protein